MKRVYLIKSKEYGWVIAWQMELMDKPFGPLVFYKAFGQWDERVDMAEYYNTEAEAVQVCSDNNYEII